jgi:predicted alpha-1,2-mannosidase
VRSRDTATWAAIGLVGLLLAGCGTTVSAPATPAAVPGLVRDPAGLVDPIAGTGTGPAAPGAIGEFPGADLPFGMIQWSPDTTPNTSAAGGGYSYQDSHVSGFSLTHLSGSGCAAYGDVPILPTVGPVGAHPQQIRASFSHATERASPGRYGVTLEPSGVNTQLSVTTRTGISRFSFPRTRQADLVFKVASSANPVSASQVRVVGRDGISGQVTSGQFCGTGTNYTVYFDAMFDRPFSSAGTWDNEAVTPGGTSCRGPACGAYVTFDTDSDQVVTMKVGISFVSVADAADNLRVEDPGWSLGSVETAATARWNGLLGRLAVGGGTDRERRTLYTALYHSLLSPTVVSDDNGRYAGADGRVHRSSTREQYANFSEWDIYRSQIELVSLLAPHQAGDMVQSLVNDARQGGWLPKWAIVAGDSGQMNGDSADPIIAAAYAFGVRDFDVRAALAAMVKGATQDETGHGLEIERQYLDQYLAQHYVTAASLDLTSSNYSIGGSVTLEYAIDDFSIAQLAGALGDQALYRSMMGRAHNWEYLFNPSTGYIQGRDAEGAFPPGPAFQTALLEPGGELGFEEGNAVQYTWSVPQDLAALSTLMGGDKRAVQKLNTFFTVLNAGRNRPFDWAGNEPGLWTPWEYDYFGAPAQAQRTVRQIADDLYSDAPVDEPGNDDLGALSSWYVWAAVGMYPVTPGSADLALASPLFPNVVVTLPDGRKLTVHAPSASPSTPYVHALTISGADPAAARPTCASGSRPSPDVTGWHQPWLPSSITTTGGTLTYALSAVPDPGWGSDPALSPPSYGTGRLAAVGYSIPSGGTTLQVGQTKTVTLGVAPAVTGQTEGRWTASTTTGGLHVSPTGGTFEVGTPTDRTVRGGLAGCTGGGTRTQVLHLRATAPGSYVVDIDLHTADGTALPPVVLGVHVTS